MNKSAAACWVIAGSLCLAVFAIPAAPARADWPAKVFAPYAYLTSDHLFSIDRCRRESGQKFFTLAFVNGDKNGNPIWNGTQGPVGQFYQKEIDDLRAAGGDVIISFGGADGQELAVCNKTDDALFAAYEKVVTTYHCTWLDFDIEGKVLDDTDANARRNRVIAKLQQIHPGLRVSYTLAADPDGLLEPAKKLLADAKTAQAKVATADIMVMDFGSHWSKGKADSTVCIESSDKVHQQLMTIDPSIGVGLCALIGVNDVKSEVFYADDARILEQYAAHNPWVCGMAFWCTNRDAGGSTTQPALDASGIPQQPWEFTKIFARFTR